MTAKANGPGHARFASMRRASDSSKHHRERYWVLKGCEREFYICTTAGPRDWRTALCVFDSEAAAEEHLESLGDARAFLNTLERYGAPMPGWMRRNPSLPEVQEVSLRELHRILEGIGVEYVTLNPPLFQEKGAETLELVSYGAIAT